MTAIGTGFLGDVQRVRVLSTSTPPSSPPPHSAPHASFSLDDVDMDPAPRPAHGNPSAVPAPPGISPEMSLELRLRWLETLLYGARHDAHDSGKRRADADELKVGDTLIRRGEDLQRRLEGAVQANDGLKLFMDRYEQFAHLLTPSFALSGTLPITPPTYENMSPSELEAFLTEMESDIRAAERDLREITTLESKGVTGAGKLAEYEALQPRLQALLKAQDDDLHTAAELEKRVAVLMDRYATNVDALSELFVSWDETIRGAEDKVSRLGRDREERQRLGYE